MGNRVWSASLRTPVVALVVALVVVLVAGLVAAPARAQNLSSSSIDGTVTDESDRGRARGRSHVHARRLCLGGRIFDESRASRSDNPSSVASPAPFIPPIVHAAGRRADFRRPDVRQ